MTLACPTPRCRVLYGVVYGYMEPSPSSSFALEPEEKMRIIPPRKCLVGSRGADWGSTVRRKKRQKSAVSSQQLVETWRSSPRGSGTRTSSGIVDRSLVVPGSRKQKPMSRSPDRTTHAMGHGKAKKTNRKSADGLRGYRARVYCKVTSRSSRLFDDLTSG